MVNKAVGPAVGSAVIISWFASGLASIVTPLFMFWIARASNSYNGQNYNNNNNRGNYYWRNQNQNQNPNNYYNNDQNYNNYNNRNGNYGGTPWWYFGANNNEEQRKEDATPPVLIAAYLWSLLIFLGLLYYGYHVMGHGGNLKTVVVGLFLFANYSIISMLLFSGVEGAIETEGPGYEEHGFVGQFGVMMYITSVFWVLFSVVFGVYLYRRAKAQETEKVEVSNLDYQIQGPPNSV